ncbi:hypothetical protein [Brevibacterium sp. ZH18]|uniref:hypothetical protein n=1 Tax=Brevibacterium sp. ZH18 TaxID=2927784 RepID=UPI001F616024|nr:hypothetical protein [Brevibacterium sp. ZH18]MCI4013025.1 hypothetical protein [Brevibacterium sp. ZH18]
MDIPSFLATYGGPGGLAVAAVWWTISDRKFSAERRAELREDIDREQKENRELREALRDKDQEIADLRLILSKCDGRCQDGR